MKNLLKLMIAATAFICGSAFAQTYTHTTINHQNKTGFDDKCMELLNAGFVKNVDTHVAATGNGFAYVASFVYTNTLTPVITPSVTLHDFGTVTVGNTSTVALRVDGKYIGSHLTATSSNTNILTVTPSTLAADANYSVSGNYVVSYTPNDSGVVSKEYLTITDDHGTTSSQIVLLGTASGSLNTIVSPSVSLIAFGTVAVPTTYTLNITAQYVRTGSISITSSDAAYTVNTSTLAASAYSAGGAVNSQIIVTFTPTGGVTSTGYLTLYAVGIVPIRVQLTGTGS